MTKKSQVIEEVINTHDQLLRWKQTDLKFRPVAITVSHSFGTRSPSINGWKVYSPWVKTDPDAHWSDNGCKFFGYFEQGGSNKKESMKSALLEAMAWASERYGPFEWERNRMGAYVPVPLNSKFPIRK